MSEQTAGASGAAPSARPASPEGPGGEAGATRVTPRLGRAAEGRLIAGVCRGLAAHLGVDVLVVRVAFVLLTAASGLGVAAYAT